MPKILVVDDEDSILRLVESMLAPGGYEVVLAHSGEECLEKFRDACPDIVLLDIMMPGMNGYEVLRILRQQSDIPVIMLTVKKEATSAIDSFHLGADDYVRKPFMKGELLARIRVKLRRTACLKCGGKVKKGDQFCSKCGASLSGESAYQRQEPQRPQKVQRDCGWCGATGKERVFLREACSVCNGPGYNLIPEDWPQCTECGGRGRISSRGFHFIIARDVKCPKCKGKGWAPD